MHLPETPTALAAGHGLPVYAAITSRKAKLTPGQESESSDGQCANHTKHAAADHDMARHHGGLCKCTIVTPT